MLERFNSDWNAGAQQSIGARQFLDKLVEDVNRLGVRPEDFAADDVTALQRAFAQGIADGIPVWLDGTYELSSPLDTVSMTDGRLIVRGSGRIHVTADMGRAILLEATYPTPVEVTSVTLTTHSFPGTPVTACAATEIEAADHGCEVGDFFKIVADDAIPGGTDSNRRVGEFGWVGDVSGDNIYLPGPLLETYTTDPRLVRVRKEPRLVWDGPTFSSTDDQEDWGIIHLTARGFVRPFIRTWVDQAYDTGVDVSSCIMAEVHVDGVKARNRAASEGVPGYLMADTQSWMTRAYVGGAGSRHSYTTLTNTSSAGGDVALFGRTRGSVVTGVAIGSSSAAFDVHSEAEGITFQGLSTAQNFLGESSSGAPFQFRGRRNKVLGLTDRGSTNGFQWSANVADGCNDNELVDCDLTSQVRVGSSSATQTVVNPRIRRGVVRHSGTASVALWKCSGMVIEDLLIAPNGSTTASCAIQLNGDAELRIRSLTVDLTDYGDTDYRIVAFAASSTGNYVVIEKVRIIGASGKLQAIFTGGDTTGTAIMALYPDWLVTDELPSGGVSINDGSMTLFVDGSAAPTGGTWSRGDKVWQYQPAAAGDIGYVCTTGGTPGTWKGWGAIAA